jgi:putative hemolysin
MNFELEKAIYSAISLLLAAIVSGLSISLQTLGRLQGKEEIKEKGNIIYYPFIKSWFPGRPWDVLIFALQFAKFTYYLIFAFVSFYFLFIKESIPATDEPVPFLKNLTFFFSSSLEVVIIILIYSVVELALMIFACKSPKKFTRKLIFPGSLLLIPCLPMVYLIFKLKALFCPDERTAQGRLPFRLQDKIIDYLKESELGRYLDKNEKKLIHTVISFKDRIVREVMVPRINVFSLSADTTILEATRNFLAEGYSRIPVYKDNVDKIIGVLLYKDVLSVYMKFVEHKESSDLLNRTIEHLVKPVLYTPETKKIAQLLQEFRNKQIHLAIIVDEYGGTEGIVTIEDILEELVGEIEDEYDKQENKMFAALSSGGWVVDAKMSIIDIEEDLGIKIPPSSEYDTIGGYIFHRAGSIPSKGWKIHLDDFDLEILRSDERSINKIKITPHSFPPQE